METRANCCYSEPCGRTTQPQQKNHLKEETTGPVRPYQTSAAHASRENFGSGLRDA